MNREVTFRQIAFMYIFISISQILRQMPQALANGAGRSGYLSPLISAVAILPITAIIIAMIKTFPGLNIYEIMSQLLGKVLVKVLLLGYMLWIFISLCSKVNAYAGTLQFTLMPNTESEVLIIALIFIVYYGLSKGMKTVFRFSEFTLGSIIVLFIILFICALPKFRLDYLLPVSTVHMPEAVFASKQVLAIGGNIIIILFFADKFELLVSKIQFRKLWGSVITLILLAFGITVFTFGITGAPLTAKLPFPFYITIKSISFFNAFERFEVLVTLICMISDFIAICIYSVVLIRCVEWFFNLGKENYLYVPITMIVYYATFFISTTVFEFAFLYQRVIINANLLFQYIIPLFLGLICLLKRKMIRKQY